MSGLQPVRGTHDILPAEGRRFRHVIETARGVAERYGFGDIVTPIFEFTEVFARTLGDTSDIVTKEMYSFEDQGGDWITLRPEGTAGVARAFISNGLAQQLPLKFFYAGPMFRYERPQKGRQRQFHQIGVELLGVPEPQADVEVIAVGAHILRQLGILDRTTLEINTLGDPESRQAYRAVLVDYFSAHRDGLSEDSRNRLERNPMRILDSKDEGDRAHRRRGARVRRPSEPGVARVLRRGARRARRSFGIGYQVNPPAGARAGLLHAHRLRVHDRPLSAPRARCWPAVAMTG